MTSVAGSASIVLHREGRVARINGINAVFNLSSNVFAISTFGLIGASVITVATEILGLLQFSRELRDVFDVRTIVAQLKCPVIASGAMAMVVLLLWELPVLAVVPIAATAYGAVLILVGGLAGFNVEPRLMRRPRQLLVRQVARARGEMRSH
jgi:O-antigen/teichoic acid export membrane protein